MKERHQIAVRTLVDYVLRAGDLEAGFGLVGRPLEGIRIHQRIQRQRPDGYRAEVAVATEIETPEMVLVIGGRIDGVLETPATTLVEEIKSTTRDLARIESAPDPCHWGQAKVYACLLAREKDLAAVAVQLTYCHIESDEILEQVEVLDREALETFFLDLVNRYLRWAATLAAWRRLRNASLDTLEFPFPTYREGQRVMAVTVYRTIRDETQAIIQAATGIGKTMAALFAAVKALGEGHIERIFFLTARNTGKVSALAALNRLQAAGLRLKRVCLTAKEQICFNPEAGCHPDACEFARGHYDRLPAAMAEIFARDNLDREAIAAVARHHRVCPFEFSLELARWADCLVCDYNYVFDPRVYLRRFFDEEQGRYTFLVDEAHNLVDRSRDMFSAVLNKRRFLELRRAVKSDLPAVYRAAGKINRDMVAVRRQTREAGGFASSPRPPEGLELLLRAFQITAERWLAKNQPATYREQLLDDYFSVNGFLRVWDQFDDSYVTCCQEEDRDFQIKLFCLDPSRQLRAVLTRCRSVVFFSATMTPADYFQEVLGCAPAVAKLSVASPFPRKNLDVLIAGGITTTYTRRTRSADAVAAMISSFVRVRKGNYLCFFPSYAYMALVAERFSAADAATDMLMQTREMDDASRAAFLDRFSAENTGTLVGFAVMGGIFGEGIDLVGERLCGAVVVGVGLPAICPERELIRGYFDARGNGFDFAYRFPGINRVLQAAGRVIRTETDRGVLLLVDQRFCRRDYSRLLPEHWSGVVIDSTGQLQERLDRFWNGPAVHPANPQPAPATGIRPSLQ